jgi:Ankyrin repeats (many copies)
MAATKSREE